ncbi:MAG TPA: lipid-A-disaccharide synthase [Phycisphaerae bacterium]|nr:lipid-A-disaccharide synthase [Phycisphaerae bacterium]
MRMSGAANQVPTFFLTAAEHSGDALGASLIGALRRRFPEARFVGVGGPRMEAAGCRLLANPVSRSAMLIGALFTESRYWFGLLKRIRQELVDLKPDVVVPIDSSTVNLRIARLGRELKIPVCYYVAPQVWASRPWRVKKIAASVDALCCVLPFEEGYFRERGVHAVYVGHPMFDAAAQTAENDPERLEPALPTGEPKVAIFPGSRRAEIGHHMPPMLAILSEIKGRFPRATFVAAAPSEERAWQIRHLLRQANTPVDIRVGNGDAIIRWADLVLTKSGTATLQIARQHKPMVVMYAVAWWKWHFFARFLITTPYLALVNILARRELVPEFIPFYGSPLPVARECIDLLAKPERRAQMAAELAELTAPLAPAPGSGDLGLAAERVAAEVARLVEGRSAAAGVAEAAAPEPAPSEIPPPPAAC